MKTLLPKILKWLEVVCLAMAAVGYVFKLQQLAGADMLLMLGLCALATVYFLSAYTVVPGSGKQESPKGIADLMPTMLRKILYLGLATFIVGFLFSLLHLPGADQLFMVGTGTLLAATVLSMVLIIDNRERMAALQDPLVRSLIVLIVFLISYWR
jgi:hypothetical protein